MPDTQVNGANGAAENSSPQPAGIAAGQLKALIQRIERLEEEKTALGRRYS